MLNNNLAPNIIESVCVFQGGLNASKVTQLYSE